MFTHLHVHTEYSLLDGMSRISELPEYIKSLGMDSCAITDHGAMFGVIDFYKSCKKAGIKPIIGCEVYTAARSMYDKESGKDRNSGHLILLAENQAGYSNLVKIVSKSYVDGFYFRPRVDKNLLRQYSDGLICLSGCLAGNVQRMLMNGDYGAARREAMELRDIFGENNFFLEIQNHHLEEDVRVIEGLRRLSADLDIPLVATNDAHYIKREDATAQDVLMCIQTQSSVTDENRMRFENDEFYVKSEEEMRELFPDLPDAIERTHEIAERCNVEFTFGEYHLPEYIPPDGMSCRDYLRKLCYDGLVERYGSDAMDLDSEYRKRLESELAVIEKMGYVEYFLIVWDFIHYAKTNGIAVGPGRGSAAGSIVAYSLDITEIDPIKYNLIFERFLNPERVSMPDIDVDFCIERRQEVIDYVVRKYGKDKVSQIITFGTLKAKAAVRDIGRVLNASYQEADEIAKAIPNELGITIAKALEINPDLKKRYESEPLVKQILDLSMALEGLPRHASTHAAGIVISKLPLDEYVPLYSSDKGLATQFNMTTIEELGLLKMDFLGLRNLTVIRDALRMIEKNHGVTIDWTKMTYDDPAVYKLIADGNTAGVFQLESGGMTGFMKNLKPTCFEDIVAGIALYRPGPMDSIPKYIENKKHPENIQYVDPHLKPILDVTYGCLIYQEQVMQIVRDLGGYSFGRSDLVRRAMSKKKLKVMLEEKEYFINGKPEDESGAAIDGCIKRGVPAEAAETIFEDMVSFASYAFNKSHAAAYAVISYETAYLKTHYPVEFMAALMSSMAGDVRHTSDYVRNCREMGIELLPPSVMSSDRSFSAVDGKIRFGLLSVKNVGTGIIDAIIEARKEVSGTHDFYEFINAIDASELNRKAIESLIQAGAFDEINSNRAVLMAICDDAVQRAQKRAKTGSRSQISLFQLDDFAEETLVSPALPKLADFAPDSKLQMEKDMLGVYLSGHPLDEYREVIERNITTKTSELLSSSEEFSTENDDDSMVINTSKYSDGDRVIMAGMLSGVKTMITRKSQEMARVSLEDYDGVIGGIIFPKIYERKRNFVRNDMVVGITGRISFKEDSDAEILIDDIVPIDKIQELGEAMNRRQGYGNGNSSSNGNGYGSGNDGGGYSGGYSPNGYSGYANREYSANQRMNTRNNAPSRPVDPASVVKLRVTQDVSDKHRDIKGVLFHLEDIMSLYPGDRDVLIYLPDGRNIRVSADKCVNFTGALRDRLVKVLGDGNVKGEIR